MGDRPLLIVMTPVRNEAWVLRAFLKATSLWADYIIVADQMSTDGSRGIYEEYKNESKCELIVIDNKNPNFNEAERQDMLIDKAREVANGRDCILFGLDADEVFDAHFGTTIDWQRIISSKPGAVFWFKWAEICPDKMHYWLSKTTYYPWVFHDDGKEEHKNYVRNMHSMRIPYPIEEKDMTYIDDFRVLHFAYLNEYRVAAKRRFYQLVDWSLNKRSPIGLCRLYAQTKKDCEVKVLPSKYVYTKKSGTFDLFSYIDSEGEENWFDVYVLEHIGENSGKMYKKLAIWDDEFCEKYGVKDARNWWDRLIHFYLKSTQRFDKTIVVRAIDKLLKKVY